MPPETDDAILADAAFDGGEASGGSLTISGAADLFLKRFENPTKDAETQPSDEDADKKRTGKAPPSEGAEDTDPKSDSDPDEDDEESEDPDDDTEDPDGDDDKSSNEKPGKTATDDDIVEITVDGETRRASVRELKRLFGQEAALTRKSQEVAEQRKAAEDQRTRYAAGLDKMIQEARANFDQYARIDFLVAQQRMDPEAFAQLRSDAQRAHDNLKYLEGELDGFIQETQAKAQSELKARAKEAITTLQDPEKGIPGWSNAVYDEIRTYGITQGLAPEVVNTIVDPVAIKMIWKAMRYDRVQSEAKQKVQRKVNAPQKVLKTQARDDRDEAATSRRDALTAMKKKGGTLDSAADAFLAMARRD